MPSSPANPSSSAGSTIKPVFGLPGYPLSALTVIREIILPFLRNYGLIVPEPQVIRACITSAIPKEIGSDEFVLCTLGRVGNRWVVSPQSKGAGVQMSAVRANAYIRVPQASEGFDAGDEVDARLMVTAAEAAEALLITGSHDPVIDYLADLIRPQGVTLLSTHVGSMGGILALKKDECHAAPTHLLADDGSYNTAYLRKSTCPEPKLTSSVLPNGSRESSRGTASVLRIFPAGRSSTGRKVPVHGCSSIMS